jgi:hypothetical protein
LHRLFDKELVQLHAADRYARCLPKIRARGIFFIHKLHSSEGKRDFWWQMDAQRSEGGNPLRQNTLSTGLVDGGSSGIQNHCMEAAPPRCDRRNDARGPGTHNDDLTMLIHI